MIKHDTTCDECAESDPPWSTCRKHRTAPAMWLRGASGERILPAQPNYTPIVLATIAHALANICRFGGHCSPHYSVAAHSVHVSRLMGTTHGAFGAICGLLHDAHEAYTGDMPKPIKVLLGDTWTRFEDAWERRVRDHFALPDASDPVWRAVKHADRVALATEHLQFLPEGDRTGWDDSPLAQPDPQGAPRLGSLAAGDAFYRRAHALGLK